MKYTSSNRFFKEDKELDPKEVEELYPRLSGYLGEKEKLEKKIKEIEKKIKNDFLCGNFLDDYVPSQQHIVKLKKALAQNIGESEKSEWAVIRVSVSSSVVFSLRRLNMTKPWEFLGQNTEKARMSYYKQHDYTEIRADHTSVVFVGETLEERLERLDKEKLDFKEKIDKIRYSSKNNAKQMMGYSKTFDIVEIPREKREEFLNLCKLT